MEWIRDCIAAVVFVGIAIVMYRFCNPSRRNKERKR